MKKVEDIPEEEELKRGEGTKMSMLNIVIGIVFLVIGILLVAFVPKYLSLLHLCYLLCAAVIAVGIFLIVRYFMKEAYKNLQEYGFSVGVILCLVGGVALVRAETLQSSFLFALGALVLVASVFKFQNSLDLKALSDQRWYIWLIVAAVFAVLGIIAVLNPFHDTEKLETFLSVVLILDGIATLIGTFYIFIRIRAFLNGTGNPKKKKEKGKKEEDDFSDEEIEGLAPMPREMTEMPQASPEMIPGTPETVPETPESLQEAPETGRELRP